MRLWARIHTRLDDDDGASLVEYALLLVLIALVAILVITQVGGSASSAFDQANKGF